MEEEVLCGASSELNQFLHVDFYVPLCEIERLFLSDFSFPVSSLGVIYKNLALSLPPLASPTIRWIWLCSQLSRSKSPQPGLLTSSWFLFCMLLIHAVGWSIIKWRKMKTWCYAKEFCCCLAYYERWVSFWANRQEGITLSLMYSTSGSFFGALVLPQGLWEEWQCWCRQELSMSLGLFLIEFVTT